MNKLEKILLITGLGISAVGLTGKLDAGYKTTERYVYDEKGNMRVEYVVEEKPVHYSGNTHEQSQLPSAYEQSINHFKNKDYEKAFEAIRWEIQKEKIPAKVKQHALKVYKTLVKERVKKNGSIGCNGHELYHELAKKDIGDWETYAVLGTSANACIDMDDTEVIKYIKKSLGINKQKAKEYFKKNMIDYDKEKYKIDSLANSF